MKQTPKMEKLYNKYCISAILLIGLFLSRSLYLHSQEINDVIRNSRNEYWQNFSSKSYFQNTIDNSEIYRGEIIDSFITIDNTLNDTVFLVEMSSSWGMIILGKIWSRNNSISFEYNPKSINKPKLAYALLNVNENILNLFTLIQNDWDQLKLHKPLCSDIADGYSFVCTRIIINENNVEVSTIMFLEFSIDLKMDCN